MRKRGTAVRIRLFAARLLILPHGMFSPSDKTDKKARPGSRFLTGLAFFIHPKNSIPAIMAATMAVKSAMRPQVTACLTLVMPTDPKYTAST